jgi:hypothetical protein
MNWFTYISLIVLSAFLFANALAFHRAAKEWAKDLSAALGKTSLDPADSALVFPAGEIQDVLVPPCVAVWFYLGFLSMIGSLIAGWICLGWCSAIVGIIVGWIATKIARGIWPQPSSQIYFAAFYECLNWRVRNYKQRGNLERARWLAYLMASTEQIEQLAKDLAKKPQAEAEHGK